MNAVIMKGQVDTSFRMIVESSPFLDLVDLSLEDCEICAETKRFPTDLDEAAIFPAVMTPQARNTS